MTVQVNESNIYKKLSVARVRFQELNVKQSGVNKFAGYTYFELSDILPVINKLGQELGFTCLVSFANDIAYMGIVNNDNPSDRIEIRSPMSTANLKGCHEVQNLGAVETYIKRYLYQNAFEIVEHDALNGTHNPNESTHKQQTEPAKPSKVRIDAWKQVESLILSSPKQSELREKFKNTPDEELDAFVTWIRSQP